MKVGVLLVFQNWHENISDEEMWMSGGLFTSVRCA